MATQPTPPPPQQQQQPPPRQSPPIANPAFTGEAGPTAEEIAKQREEEARKVFDAYEDEDDDRPVTAQTDQLRRAADIEKVGPAAYMAEQERRIRDRQGDPPLEPRQVHGVAPAPKPPTR